MATMILAAGTAISSAVTTAGAAVSSMFGGGAAAAGAGAAASAGKGVVTLSRVLSAGSALASIGQGIAASNTAKANAAIASAQADQEEAAGASKARDLAREYRELTSEQRVIQLANGLDIGVGTPVSVRESSKRMAERNISTTRENAGNRAAISRLRSRGLMSEARASMMGGFGRAATIGLDSYQLTG